jgi:hypothetical protein
MRGHQDAERYPDPDSGINKEVSAGLFDDSICCRQTQPYPFARIFLRSERLENFILLVCGNTNSRIMYAHHHIPARSDSNPVTLQPFMQDRIFGLDPNITAVRHRVMRVNNQIHQNLLKLSLVCANRV